MNVHEPTKDKNDDTKDILYEEQDEFPKYHMNIFLRDLNAEVARKYIFKPTTRNENLNEVNNDNGLTVVNVATS
jgi:hypothetical protein